MMIRSALAFLLALPLAAVVGACGKPDAKKPAAPVAATVNDQEVSVHQVNLMLERVARWPVERAKPTPAQVLERIIDEELMVQKARQAKLDRDPRVMQAIEEAQRLILAQAYLDKVITPGARSTPEEVRAFYVENPALFERRRVYRFLEMVAAVPEEKLDALKTQAAKAKTLNEVAAWLRTQQIAYNFATWTKPTEQLPRGYAARFVDAKNGQIVVVDAPGGGTSVIQILQTKDAPLTEQQARPVIERTLALRKRAQLAEADLKRLRDKARIEYAGEFQATRPETKAQPAAMDGDAPKATTASHWEKGLSSLR